MVPKLKHVKLFNYVLIGPIFLYMSTYWSRTHLGVVWIHIAIIYSSEVFYTPEVIFLRESLKPPIRPQTLHKVSYYLLNHKHRLYFP